MQALWKALCYVILDYRFGDLKVRDYGYGKNQFYYSRVSKSLLGANMLKCAHIDSRPEFSRGKKKHF